MIYPGRAVIVTMLLAAPVMAITRYVDGAGANPMPPFDDWSVAATNIQDAVDVAETGDVVMVRDGTYSTGYYSREDEPGLLNVVLVTNAIEIRAEGSSAIIDGRNQARCAWLCSNAVLSGLTLHQGVACVGGDPAMQMCFWDGGGVYGPGAVLTNCWIENCRARNGGGAFGADLSGCTLWANAASSDGGGVLSGRLANCTLYLNTAAGEGGGLCGGMATNCDFGIDDGLNMILHGNSAARGGGVARSQVVDCRLRANTAQQGGGAYQCELSGSTIQGNQATGAMGAGGGVWGGSVSNCWVIGNTTVGGGGGVSGQPGDSMPVPTFEVRVSVRNSTLSGNSAQTGGGAAYADLEDCTVSGNSASSAGAAGRDCAFTNCVIESNRSGSGTVLSRCALSACAINANTGCGVVGDDGFTSVQEVRDCSFVANVNECNAMPSMPSPFLLAASVSNCVFERNQMGAGVGAHCFFVDVEFRGNTASWLGWVDSGDRLFSNCVFVGNSDFAYRDDQFFNCLIESNRSQSAFLTGGVMEDCLFRGNIGLMATNCTVRRCDFSRQVSSVEFTMPTAIVGGGTLEDCVLRDNDVGSSPVATGVSFSRCRVEGNSSTYYGCAFPDVQAERSVFRGNVNAQGTLLSGFLSNCVIAANQASKGACDQNSQLTHCTVVFNVASQGVGGVSGCDCRNSIIAGNTGAYGDNWTFDRGTEWAPELPMFTLSSFSGCCTFPQTPDGGSVTNDPRFRDAATGDYHLRADSPCIDAGYVGYAAGISSDLDALPRVFNGRPDQGAFEFNVETRVAGLLGAAAVPGTTGRMASALGAAGLIPLTSPYAADPVTVTSVPTGAVDWVLVQLYRTSDGNLIRSRSAFLLENGQVEPPGGGADLHLEVAPGRHVMALKHRNHLGLRLEGLADFTTSRVDLAFAQAPWTVAGGTGSLVAVEAGRWAMVPGDADGDGRVTETDRAIVTAQFGRHGYLPGDVDMDGDVTAADLSLVDGTLGRTADLARAEVLLAPSLSVSPPRRTLMVGTNVEVAVGGGGTSVVWFTVARPSGGQLAVLSTNTARYTVGSTGGVVDAVEAWDGDYRFGRALLNIITPEDIAALGKAVIVAGGKSLSDPVWAVTDDLADKAYDTLRYLGFAKTNIQYISFDPAQDVDGDGQLDDIDLPATRAGVAMTFTNWAANSDRLFVFLVDHGEQADGLGYFRLNAGELLTSLDLDGWLDTLQQQYGTEVTVVLDFCYAGMFLRGQSWAAPPPRAVLASCAADELTWFVSGGQVSYSDALFNGLFRGLSLGAAHVQAREAMSTYQSPWIDDTGDGIWQDGVDGAWAASLAIGPSFIAGKDAPMIGDVSGSQALDGTRTATLWADHIAADSDLSRVWCVILPPSQAAVTNDGGPVLEAPVELDLDFNAAAGRYEVAHTNFGAQGLYKVSFYARDVWDSVSSPRHSYVTQRGFHEQAIIVAGGPSNETSRSTITNLAAGMYRTLRLRQVEASDIRLLCAGGALDATGDGANDAAGDCTLAALAAALTEWATNAARVTLYLVGQTNELQQFRLNETEGLASWQLRTWLDDLQRKGVAATVIMDFPNSGDYLRYLGVPPDVQAERICLASTQEARPVFWQLDGMISFSQYFMSCIRRGLTIGQAFDQARASMLRSSGRALRQLAQRDDDGDGVPDEKNEDGVLSRVRHIGSPFVTGNDVPELGAVMPDQVLGAATSVVAWAADVVDADGVSNVWCVVTPPGWSGEGELPALPLHWNGASGRFETTLALTQRGYYGITFLACDNRGELATPREATLLTTDPFEPDDDVASASLLDLGARQTGHVFHSETDEDWVRFYAVTGAVYEISAEQWGTNVDVKLDLYRQRPDGTLEAVEEGRDFFGAGAGEVERIDLNLVGAAPDEAGFYLLRVSSADAGRWGIDSDYDVEIIVPSGGGNLVVVVADLLNAGASPPDSVVQLRGPVETNRALFGALSTSFSGLPAGAYTVSVSVATGYEPEADPAVPGQVENPASAYYGNPRGRPIAGDAWQSAVFTFVPMLTATGVVRDALTGAFVTGANLRWEMGGALTGLVYSRYPQNAVYALPWQTEQDGGFPSTVRLPAVSMGLQLSLAGYSNFAAPGVLVNPAAGYATNLGTLLLWPLDTNGNGIADAWEAQHFPGGTTATNDTDGDGVSDRAEYWLDTDPTNAASVFKAGNADLTNGLTLRWPVSAGRAYAVWRADELVTDAWSVVAGPWTAAVGQATMQWTETAPGGTGRYYGVRAHLPN